MIWMFLLLSFPVIAQIDLSATQILDEELPNFRDKDQQKKTLDPEKKSEVETSLPKNKYRPPKRVISLEKIMQSGTQLGAMNPGVPITDYTTGTNHTLSRPIYVRFLNLEDENGFKYIQNKDGSVRWKALSRFIEPIKQELNLYEPPHRYTPAPNNIVRAEYDKKLSIPPEVSFYAGVIQGNYIKDLFNDDKAKSGISNQYGLHVFTQWKLPIKAGAVLHYEKSTYDLDDGGQVVYSAPSFGPQFKTRDFEISNHLVRLQLQFRVSPFAKATGQKGNQEATYKFNSTDLLASLETPFKNRFGEFVLGFYSQTQWLNLKDLTTPVNVNPTNETNQSIGLSLSQVFE